MTIYDKVKAEADLKKISIAALEVKAGVANGTISKWKTGKPLAETLMKVANALEVKINDLMDLG